MFDRYAKHGAAIAYASNDKVLFDKSAQKVKQKQAELKAFSERTGNPIKLKRTQVVGYNKSVTGKVTQSAKRQTAEEQIKRQEQELVREIRSAGGFAKSAKIHLRPTPIDVDSLGFDDVHVNAERMHNVTETQAKQWINESSVSVAVWAGKYECYYGMNGTAYVDLPDK